MPAKKERPTAELKRLRKLVSTLQDDLMHMEQQLTEANAAIAAANVLLAKGRETMREHASQVVELNQALLEVREHNAEVRVQLIAEKRELEFWVEESDRYRDKVVALLRHQAIERAKHKGDS